MAANLKVINNDAEFATELTSAGTRLVVVDFHATWCGPCRNIAPHFAAMATRYPQVNFLKVDVDKCQEVAQREGITAMPTFNFYISKVKVDTMKGADPIQLEDHIKKHVTDDGDDGDSPVKGHMDLISLVCKSGSECLNESDDHTLEHGLSAKGGYLESDCDEQLIISLSFNQAVKLHSLKLNCSKENGPKVVKLFINQPNTLDFDSADSMEPLQLFNLVPEDLCEGALIPLKYVKLQNVLNLTLFVKDNQNGDETTRIDHLSLIGSPTTTTNMSDFKRVAGKKGESH